MTLGTQRVVGLLFILAGIAKPFPQIEDVPQLLALAARANQGTPWGGASQFFSDNTTLTISIVALSMIASGVCQLRDNSLVLWAAIGQTLMLCCFSLFLHRHQPVVIPVDVMFLLAEVVIIYRVMRLVRRSEGD